MSDRSADELDRQVASLASLGEPIRRSLYRFVVEQGRPVSRDDAAAGVGVARHIAKFHLDRLASDGLLDTDYARTTGRTGPGAGRPAKLYRRCERDIAVTLPERRYELAARILARAVTTMGDIKIPISDALRRAAEEEGRVLAKDIPQDPPSADLLDLLGRIGYQPRTGDRDITLANCPFHQLAADYTKLVCGLNLDLLRSMLHERSCTNLEARLDPAPDRCCVVIGPKSQD